MELFFALEDARKLYSWDQSMQFLAICELASGTFPDCKRSSFPNYEDFKICVEAKLTLLTCFNYISEDEKARITLYNVCRYNRSKHVIENDETQTYEEGIDSIQFNQAFGSFDDFNNLFE